MATMIYFDEVSATDFANGDFEYHACKSCGHAPLIWQSYVGDAICEGCGKWQNGN
jgi:ribosomal protein S27E